jgi:hypothetical protein
MTLRLLGRAGRCSLSLGHNGWPPRTPTRIANNSSSSFECLHLLANYPLVYTRKLALSHNCNFFQPLITRSWQIYVPLVDIIKWVARVNVLQYYNQAKSSRSKPLIYVNKRLSILFISATLNSPATTFHCSLKVATLGCMTLNLHYFKSFRSLSYVRPTASSKDCDIVLPLSISSTLALS